MRRPNTGPLLHLFPLAAHTPPLSKPQRLSLQTPTTAGPSTSCYSLSSLLLSLPRPRDSGHTGLTVFLTSRPLPSRALQPSWPCSRSDSCSGLPPTPHREHPSLPILCKPNKRGLGLLAPSHLLLYMMPIIQQTIHFTCLCTCTAHLTGQRALRCPLGAPGA